jgi:hypothetical protein
MTQCKTSSFKAFCSVCNVYLKLSKEMNWTETKLWHVALFRKVGKFCFVQLWQLGITVAMVPFMGCKTIGAFSQSGQSFVTQHHVNPWEDRDPYNAVIAFLLAPLGSYCVFVVQSLEKGKQERCSYACMNKISFDTASRNLFKTHLYRIII